MSPTPPEIRAARVVAGLSQTAAAALIQSTMRTWQDWEAGKAAMHPGLWELFMIKIFVK
jgi:DNA-binding transcriptional regulator YiaG